MRKADVYHAHDFNTLLPAFVAAKLTGGKVIYDAHELTTEQDDSVTLRKKVTGLVEKFLLKRVDKVIAANEPRAKIMYEEYGAEELPTAIINCPPCQTIPQTERLSHYLKNMGVFKKKIALYQGALMPGRCLENVVKSAEYLDDNIVIVFLGKGHLKEELVRLVKELSLEKKVFFHPVVPAEILLSYTASADLGIVIYKNNCRNNYYCAPNKLFEYLICNAPVAACDFPVLRGIVMKYQVGDLFDPENPKSIAASINSIFGEEQKLALMKSNARLVLQDYNWENQETKLLKLYADILT